MQPKVYLSYRASHHRPRVAARKASSTSCPRCLSLSSTLQLFPQLPSQQARPHLIFPHKSRPPRLSTQNLHLQSLNRSPIFLLHKTFLFYFRLPSHACYIQQLTQCVTRTLSIRDFSHSLPCPAWSVSTCISRVFSFLFLAQCTTTA